MGTEFEFKVGDRVRVASVTEPVANYIKALVGSVGKIVDLYLDDDCYYQVDFSDGKVYWFFEEELRRLIVYKQGD